MVNYKNGKIYKLVSHQTDDIYVGSTCNDLRKRLSTHKCNYRQWKDGKYPYITSYEILNYDDVDIVLLETYPCENKNELHAQERYWIEQTKCVNKYLPTRTKQEYSKYYRENNQQKEQQRKKIYREKNKPQMKEYRENNKDKIKEQKKQWYNDNQDRVIENRKQYYLDKKDEILERNNKYRENNIDKIKSHVNEKIECPKCKRNVSRNNMKRHQQSNRCQQHE